MPMIRFRREVAGFRAGDRLVCDADEAAARVAAGDAELIGFEAAVTGPAPERAVRPWVRVGDTWIRG